MVVTIHHAQIMIAPGEEAAVRRFYVELLGLIEIPKPPVLAARGGFWLAAGDKQVHVGVDAHGSPRGRTHVAYAVHGLDALCARLGAAGFAIQPGEDVDGLKRVELRDPAGNRVELLEG